LLSVSLCVSALLHPARGVSLNKNKCSQFHSFRAHLKSNRQPKPANLNLKVHPSAARCRAGSKEPTHLQPQIQVVLRSQRRKRPGLSARALVLYFCRRLPPTRPASTAPARGHADECAGREPDPSPAHMGQCLLPSPHPAKADFQRFHVCSTQHRLFARATSEDGWRRPARSGVQVTVTHPAPRSAHLPRLRSERQARGWAITHSDPKWIHLIWVQTRVMAVASRTHKLTQTYAAFVCLACVRPPSMRSTVAVLICSMSCALPGRAFAICARRSGLPAPYAAGLHACAARTMWSVKNSEQWSTLGFQSHAGVITIR
jgi:hypothetical protein